MKFTELQNVSGKRISLGQVREMDGRPVVFGIGDESVKKVTDSVLKHPVVQSLLNGKMLVVKGETVVQDAPPKAPEPKLAIAPPPKLVNPLPFEVKDEEPPASTEEEETPAEDDAPKGKKAKKRK